MNLGKAYLENRESKRAIAVLKKAVEIKPRSPRALRNLARAYLLAKQPEAAREILLRAEKVEPENPGTSYLLALTYLRKSKFAEALPYLERAVRLDPGTATLRFQLANAYQLTGQHEKAKVQLRETLRLDPLHASAHFKLSAYARREGDREAVRRHTREFVRLRKLFGDQTRTARALEQCVYTRPEAAVPATSPQEWKPPPRIEVRFREAPETLRSVDAATLRRVAVLGLDKQGRYELLALRQDGQWLHCVAAGGEGGLRCEPVSVGSGSAETLGRLLVGDYHDDVPKNEKYDFEKHALQD
ncbi:MAG: hypothetical protein D6788_10240, partial [Planctomycetota bacterium]